MLRLIGSAVLIAVLAGCASVGHWEPIPDPVNGKAYPCCFYPHGYRHWVVGPAPAVLPQTRGIEVVGQPLGTVATIRDFFIEPQEQGVPIDPNTGELAHLPNPLWDWMLPQIVRELGRPS